MVKIMQCTCIFCLFYEDLRVPRECEGQAGPDRATWSSCRRPCSLQGSRTRWLLKVLSKWNNSMILWTVFYWIFFRARRSEVPGASCPLTIKVAVKWQDVTLLESRTRSKLVDSKRRWVRSCCFKKTKFLKGRGSYIASLSAEINAICYIDTIQDCIMLLYSWPAKLELN